MAKGLAVQGRGRMNVPVTGAVEVVDGQSVGQLGKLTELGWGGAGAHHDLRGRGRRGTMNVRTSTEEEVGIRKGVSGVCF